MLPVVRQGLYISEDSYSLKNMEIFYEFKREGDVQKADASQEYYIEWLESEENSILKEIENYNKQDCESTYELHQWLLSIKPQETDWNDETIEEIELKEWEELNQNLKKRIKNSSINNEQVKKLLLVDVI